MAKLIRWSAVFLMVFSSFYAANDEITLSSKLMSVKVFLRGAELQHTANIKLESGLNELVFSGLPIGIDQSSIQVTAEGNAVILSVAQRTNYLKAQQRTEQVQLLEDSLKILKYNIGRMTIEKEVLSSETDLILSNKIIGGKEKGVTVSDLKAMDSFFKERLTVIKNSILDIDLKIELVQKEIKRIEDQLDELNKKRNIPVNEIVLTVSTKTATTLNMQLSYMIYDAGWTPSYDIRVTDIEHPSKLTYKADVWQNSGIDWLNTKIILSTRDARQGGTKPELYPWFIDFAEEYPVTYGAKHEALRKTMEVTAMAPESMEAETMADYMVVNRNQLAVEFVPDIKYSIPSDRKPHTVMLHEYELPARYEYYCVPKLDRDAFLVAYLSDWGEFNLLPGKVNIYFENSFVGNTSINPYVSKDTLAVSLGRDKNIVVTRDMLKDFTEDKFLSSDVERIFSYEISIRNNKAEKVQILVEDQLPISQNEDIEVKLIDKSGAAYDKDTGKIRWILEIDPSQVVKKKFVFSVRYPKDRNISNL